LQLERELVGFKQKQVSQLGGYFYGPGQMIVGTSEKMAALYRKIDRIAPTNATVLITGETGTGKELVARAIHYNSPRRLKPFIPVLIVATPKEQIEAELFGIGRRIATQVDARPGKFREAEYGTLFLDEIGEVSLDIQPKLLRAIERKEIQGVGMPTTTVDVRIIASTNKALEQAAEKGEFREDLWFRISVVKLVVPPLRERKSDIPMLAEHFLRTKAAQHGKSIIGFQEGTIDFLTGYSWPGNVRELENSIEQVVVFDEDGWISVDDIKNQMQINSPVERAVALPRLKASLSLFDHVENYERTLIIDALKKSNWIKTQAAGQLRVPESTLRSKMKQLGISEDEPVEK
jgi:two-component system response regulator AtoC